MKKGLHIVCASGLVLAVSIAAIGCQKDTVETVPETTVPVTETIIELAEDESITEAEKETKKEALKDSEKETSKKDDKKEASEEKGTSKKETQKSSKPAETQKPSKPTGTQKPSKPEETQKPSKPAETQKPSKPAETQKPSKPAETQKPSKPAETKPQHQHDWAAKTELITHPEEGHYETVVVKEAWDEPIYETKVVCGCGAIFNNDYEWEQHSLDGCIYGYSVQSVQVGTKHHDAVTEPQWVVDKKAWYESVIVGYECQCGATK